MMSGTSVDSIDVSIVDFSQSKKLLTNINESYEIKNTIRKKIQRIIGNPLNVSLMDLGELNALLGNLYADAVLSALSKNNISPNNIIAIGNHGQTIFHSTNTENKFSLQIGDSSIVATRTGIPCICDFRSSDIAMGGEGAPLSAGFHEYMFKSGYKNRIILNLGGIANITVLNNNITFGYDTGPANTLIDNWINKIFNKNYDNNGDWARSGNLNSDLLESLLSEPYFNKSYPKSSGRELFNLEWLNNHLQKNSLDIPPEDIQRTLTELTAKSIWLAIKTHKIHEIYICGGGYKNKFLIERIKSYCPNLKIYTTKKLGIDPEYVESICFAWLAFQYLNKRPGNIPTVTGAKIATILGCKYLPKPNE